MSALRPDPEQVNLKGAPFLSNGLCAAPLFILFRSHIDCTSPGCSHCLYCFKYLYTMMAK